MKDRDWNSLVESLRNGRCVLVLGPEIAADWSESGRAANPGSTTLAGALTDWLAEELIEVRKNLPIVRSLPAVAQLYEDAEAEGLGADKLHTQAAQFYTSLRLKPSKDHEAIAALPFPLVISTCHDQLLTDAFIKAKKPPLVTRYHYRGGDEDENNKIPRPTPSPRVQWSETLNKAPRLTAKALSVPCSVPSSSRLLSLTSADRYFRSLRAP